MDPSSSSTAVSANVTSGITMDRIWRSLPEEILDMIVLRLPFAAQARLRRECKNWKELLARSPPPPSMILRNLRDRNARFYCESERRWYNLPSTIRPPSFQNDVNTTWEVVDVDAGLVCYQCDEKEWLWLWVCNPLQPSLSKLIKAHYLLHEGVRQLPQLKLVVNRETKAFKVVMMMEEWIPHTLVYDSRTSGWRFCTGFNKPDFRPFECFLWKNVLYAYDVKKRRGQQRSRLAAFNLESERWVNFDAELPSEFQFPTHHHFLSDNEQVLLVLFSYRKRPQPYFSVWKLLCEDLHSESVPAGDLRRWEKWQKIDLRSEADIVNLEGYRVTGAFLGLGCICLTFSSDDNFNDLGSETQKCVRYSFGTKTWSLVPSPEAEGWRKTYRLHSWEPCPDIDPSQ